MSHEQSLVYIVDDDSSVRESIESLVCSVGHAARLFSSTRDFFVAERPNVPSCLVLDVRFPGPSGLEFQRHLTESEIEIPVVFVTGHGDIAMSVTAMKAGAIEFLTKPFRDQDLLDAVHRGIELDRARRANTSKFVELRGLYDTLTPREREVMELVVAGQLNKQIAAHLDLSEVTVKVHRAQVMHKMHAKSLPDLVRRADMISAYSRND